MGIEITKNKAGKYRLVSTITDTNISDNKEWLSEKEAKKALLDRAFWDFVNSVIAIQEDFPIGRVLNGRVVGGERKSNEILDKSDASIHQHFLSILYNHDMLGYFKKRK